MTSKTAPQKEIRKPSLETSRFSLLFPIISKKEESLSKLEIPSSFSR